MRVCLFAQSKDIAAISTGYFEGSIWDKQILLTVIALHEHFLYCAF